MGYPSPESEIEILKGSKSNKLDVLNNIISSNELLEYQKMAENTFVKDNIYSYIVDIVNATRNNPYVSIGISPRGSIAILKMAKANAVFNDRDYVIQEDVLDIIEATAAHRIELSSEAMAKGLTEKQVINNIVGNVKLKG